MLAPHALKGQKLLAQGSALGIMAIGKAPVRAKADSNQPSACFIKDCGGTSS